jgi:hypothetical protein
MSGAGRELFEGRMLLQWILISKPRHEFLAQTLFNIVKTIKFSYMRDNDYLSQSLKAPYFSIICSTGPGVFTASVHQVILSSSTQINATYRYAGIDFLKYGGRFKANNEVWDADPGHYSKRVKNGESLLVVYKQRK